MILRFGVVVLIDLIIMVDLILVVDLIVSVNRVGLIEPVIPERGIMQASAVYSQIVVKFWKHVASLIPLLNYYKYTTPIQEVK